MESSRPLLSDDSVSDTSTISEAWATSSEKPISRPKALLARLCSQVHQQNRGVLRVISACLAFVLPRWTRSSWPGQQLHATSWLNALRGYAALAVLNLHIIRPKATKHWFFNLPLINCMWAGWAAVDIFFVISGFVLTQSILQKIRAKQNDQVLKRISSAVLRRWIRLFAPCAAITFVAMLLIHFGFVNGAPKPTLLAELWNWATEIANFCDPLNPVSGWWHGGIVNVTYDDYLWTIPTEFRGSLIVYLFVTGTSGLQSKHRLILGWLIAVAFCARQETYAALFMAGACLAEISLIRFPERYSGSTLPTAGTVSLSEKQQTERTVTWRRVGYAISLIAGIWLLGCDAHYEKPTFYWVLDPFTPSWWRGAARLNWWPTLAAPLLIWSLDSWTLLQKPLNSRISQILGELSFGMYVTQQLVHRSIYDRYLSPLLRLGIFSGYGWYIGTPIILVLNLLFVAWAADHFDRVDAWIVRTVRRIEKRITQD